MTKRDLVDLVRKWVPARARYAIQRVIPVQGLKEEYFAARDPLSAVASGEGEGPRVGILRNRAQRHTLYVRACREMGVPFRVIDIEADGWMERAEASRCAVFLAWPNATQTPLASATKERCRALQEELGRPVFPGVHEQWMYEDKYRLREWLMANGVAHPRTWVFLRKADAKAFAETCALPVVFKMGFGAKAAGVKILRSRKDVRAVVKQAFGRGHAADGFDRRDREWGRVLFQEFIPDAREWRLVRIGESYFGHPKGRLGDFHSGSGLVEWDVPEARHLDLLHEVTEKGGFRSMCVDTFETPDGRLLVNELQTVFGASASVDQMRKDGVAGRMVRSADGAWTFEPGDWARNACANERVRYALGRWGGGAPNGSAAPEAHTADTATPAATPEPR